MHDVYILNVGHLRLKQSYNDDDDRIEMRKTGYGFVHRFSHIRLHLRLIEFTLDELSLL